MIITVLLDMINKPESKKTIALPISIHQKAGELANKVGMKQYEFIVAAILLAEADEKFLQEIVNTHAKRFSLNALDPSIRKKLEDLSITELDALLAHLKQKKD